MNITIKENGSFDVTIGSVTFADCFPGIDSRPFRASSVEVQGQCIRYHNVDVELELQFHSMDFGLRIAGRLLRSTYPLHTFSVIHEAVVRHGGGVFVQTLGLRGESGFKPEVNTLTNSYGITAVCGLDDYCCIGAYDHTRFVNQYQFSPNVYHSGESIFSASFVLEKTVTGQVPLELPEILFIKADHLENGLRCLAEKTAAHMHARVSDNRLFHWCSWYYNFYYFNQQQLAEYLAAFRQYRDRFPFQYIQIDAGYCATPGDWLTPNQYWEDGIGAAFSIIWDAGYEPALWIAPYIVGNYSQLYREHPDWVLHHLDGSVYIEKAFYEWAKPWPNPDTEYYILDISHPQALEYIVNVFRTFRLWGCRMFKMDFMLWAMKDSASVRRYDNSKTSVEYFRLLLQKVRDAVGEDVYLLGCIAPFLPFVGYADGMRIAGDVVSQWVPEHIERITNKFLACNYFNRVYWENDPDVLQIRDKETDLKSNEVESLALLQAILGGVVSVSDNITAISENRKRLLDFLKPTIPHCLTVPDATLRHDQFVIYLKNGDRYVVFMMNRQDHVCIAKYYLRDILPLEAAFVYDWKKKRCSDTPVDELYTETAPRDFQLFFISDTPITEVRNIYFDEAINYAE